MIKHYLKFSYPNRLVALSLSKSEHEVRKRELKTVQGPRSTYNPIIEGDLLGVKEIKKRKFVIPSN